MLSELREATRPQHEAIENELALATREWDLQTYTLLLGRWLRYLEPLEARLADRPEWLEWGYDFEARRKAPLLRRDLAVMPEVLDGRGTESLQWPEVTHFGAALGCLYVLEGSTLGGQVLSRRFGEILGIGPDSGLAYFSGYGELTGQRWRQTLGLLEMVPNSLSRDSQAQAALTSGAVSAARMTFETLRCWLCPL